MSSAAYERIRKNPKFAQLVATRTRFALTLSVLVLGLYFGFVFTVAFNPAALAAPLVTGGHVTVGFLTAVGLIFGFWLLTGYYAQRANTEFDAINNEIIADSLKEIGR